MHYYLPSWIVTCDSSLTSSVTYSRLASEAAYQRWGNWFPRQASAACGSEFLFSYLVRPCPLVYSIFRSKFLKDTGTSLKDLPQAKFKANLASEEDYRDFSGGPVAKTLHSRCWGTQFSARVRELDPTCHNWRSFMPGRRLNKDPACHTQDPM